MRAVEGADDLTEQQHVDTVGAIEITLGDLTACRAAAGAFGGGSHRLTGLEEIVDKVTRQITKNEAAFELGVAEREGLC